MPSVTSIVRKVKQPRGGYLPWWWFEKEQLEDEVEICSDDSITPQMVGLVVDYMTRLLMGTTSEEAFSISLRGAKKADFQKLQDFKTSKNSKRANQLLQGINGLDKTSITNACNLVVYDAWYRNPVAARNITIKTIRPSNNAINNIKTMVERSLLFFERYGPVIKSGFTFEGGGYTDVVSRGDGDFLTKDTLWDFKVSAKEPTSEQTLQLLMYWIMGKHSGQEEYQSIQKIGIFNPRLNTVYRFDIANLNIQIIQEIEKSIIGYKDWYTEEDYSFSFHPIPPKERPKQSTHWSKEKVEKQREKRRLVLQESIKDYDYELIRYVSAETPVTLKCKKCGNEWTATRYRMETGKTSCPICFPVEKTPKKQRLTEEEKAENRRNRFVGKIYKKSDGTIRIDSYCGAKQRTQATCLTCGYTWSPVAEHLMQKCWCPQCKKEGRVVVENSKIERNT